MKINNLMHNRLMGRTVAFLSHALNFHTARHNIIAENLAHIDTPGYIPKKIAFSKELENAAERKGIHLKSTNPRHFPLSSGAPLDKKKSFVIQTQDTTTMKLDGYGIDDEMAMMAKNNLLYEASARLLSKKFEALKMAIDAGRR